MEILREKLFCVGILNSMVDKNLRKMVRPKFSL